MVLTTTTTTMKKQFKTCMVVMMMATLLGMLQLSSTTTMMMVVLAQNNNNDCITTCPNAQNYNSGPINELDGTVCSLEARGNPSNQGEVGQCWPECTSGGMRCRCGETWVCAMTDGGSSGGNNNNQQPQDRPSDGGDNNVIVLTPTPVPVTTVQPVSIPTTDAPVFVPVTAQPVSIPTTDAPVFVPVTAQPVSIPTTDAPVFVPVTAQPVSIPTTYAPVFAPVTAQPVALSKEAPADNSMAAASDGSIISVSGSGSVVVVLLLSSLLHLLRVYYNCCYKYDYLNQQRYEKKEKNLARIILYDITLWIQNTILKMNYVRV